MGKTRMLCLEALVGGRGQIYVKDLTVLLRVFALWWAILKWMCVLALCLLRKLLLLFCPPCLSISYHNFILSYRGVGVVIHFVE